MMQSKISRMLILFILIALVGPSGCQRILIGLLSNGRGLERVEGVARYYDAMTRASGHIFTLPERRFIRQIVLHPNGPIKGLEIFVRSGDEQWRRIEQIKGRKESAVIIDTAVGADAIRVIEKSYGYIRDIEVFASAK